MYVASSSSRQSFCQLGEGPPVYWPLLLPVKQLRHPLGSGLCGQDLLLPPMRSCLLGYLEKGGVGASGLWEWLACSFQGYRTV